MRRGNAAPLSAYFYSFSFRPPRFLIYPGGHNGQNVLTPPTAREQPRRSETGDVCISEDECAEMLRGRASSIYLAADSKNCARRPPRPEMCESARGNRDQHYRTKKKETAGTGARTEKRKPREKKERSRGAGESRAQKRENRIRAGASKKEKTAAEKRGRRGLPSSDLSRGVRRIVDTSRGRGGHVGVALPQITRAAYPRRNLAQPTRGATLLAPAPHPRDEAKSAGRKLGAGSSRKR